MEMVDAFGVAVAVVDVYWQDSLWEEQQTN